MGWLSKKYAIEYTGQRGVGKKVPSEDEFLSRFLPAVPSLVLDAGGGNGRWSLGFFELGYEVCLVDFNLHMLRMAKEILKNAETHIILSDIRSLPFRSEIFDFALCEADPISQCRSKKEALTAMKSLSRVLKKGSILTGSLSNRYFWIIKMMSEASNEKDLEEILYLLNVGAFKPKRGYQMHLFTPNEFKEEAKRVGFRPLELIPYAGLIVSPFILRRSCNQSGGFSQKLQDIENKLGKDAQSMYFSRRFRFAVKKIK